tara:strand:- start:22099 stop:22671 length:573 start_codon:yes stop_codon:yes gene_type:complete
MNSLLEESITIWRAGGPLMFPLALLAFGLFYAQTRLLLQIRHHQPGPITSIWTGKRSIPEAFESAREQILHPIDRRIRYYAILVGVCPLLGLLGTVAGMTTTFTGMARPGASNLSLEVAGGVSEALVTTQAGLLVAIPGMILLSFLRRGRDRIALRYYALEAQVLANPTSLHSTQFPESTGGSTPRLSTP